MGLVMLGLLFTAGVVLFCAGIIVLGCGAWLFANAAAAVHRARAHGLSADEQQRIGAESHEAIDELRRVAARAPIPDIADDELAAAIIAQRENPLEDDESGDVPSVFMGGIYAKTP